MSEKRKVIEEVITTPEEVEKAKRIEGAPFGIKLLTLAIAFEGIIGGFFAIWTTFLRLREINLWISYGENLRPNFPWLVGITVFMWIVTFACLWDASLLWTGKLGTWTKALCLNIFNSVVGVPLLLFLTTDFWEFAISDVVFYSIWILGILAFVPYMTTRQVKDFFR